MTPLRQRMIEDLQLRGMSERTQEMDVRAVHQLAAPYHTSPDQITEEELRDSYLSLKHVQRYSRSARTIALCGLTFFSEHTLKRAWSTLSFVRASHAQKFSVILRPQEVHGLLKHVRLMRSQVCLRTIYACGLRLHEGTHLQIHDIDRARMLVHVCWGATLFPDGNHGIDDVQGLTASGFDRCLDERRYWDLPVLLEKLQEGIPLIQRVLAA